MSAPYAMPGLFQPRVVLCLLSTHTLLTASVETGCTVNAKNIYKYVHKNSKFPVLMYVNIHRK